MTDTIAEHAAPDLKAGIPLVEMEEIGKSYGAINALEGIDGAVALPDAVHLDEGRALRQVRGGMFGDRVGHGHLLWAA